MTDYTRIPVDYMVDGVRRYIENGIRPGHFLQALFSNDLKESFKRADDNNAIAMREWAKFVYWEMPSESQGSPAKVQAWIDQGGWNGIQAARAKQAEEESDGR